MIKVMCKKEILPESVSQNTAPELHQASLNSPLAKTEYIQGNAADKMYVLGCLMVSGLRLL